MTKIRLLLSAAFLTCLAMGAQAQGVVGSAVVDGRVVELLSDQTWRYAKKDASEGQETCTQIHARVAFCGDAGVWQRTETTNPAADAMFRHDDRHYSQFIAENIGTNDGLTMRYMRDTVLSNVASATGQTKREVNVLGVEEVKLGGETAETIIYSATMKGTPAVFANTIYVDETLTLQAMTLALASDYTDEHRKLHARFLAATRLE